MIDNLLKISLISHQPITIIYQKGREITERKIRVINMDDNKVEAFCYLRHQRRLFKKDNILSAMYAH